jgi:protein-S-isoprenylcysteine O-methyltransferase Ste14
VKALAPTLGGFFFRWRSYLPFVLLPLAVVAIARFQLRFDSHAADLLWEVACTLLAGVGLAIRVYTVGVAAPGTSGRGTRRPKAAFLNTTGPYSVVRHPLYLGNALIAMGLALFPHTWLAPVVVAPVVAGYYACIARWEEQYLRAQFGVAFETWARNVPAIIPAFDRYVPAQRSFDPKRVLRSEFHGLALILVAPLIIDVIEDLIEDGVFHLDPFWAGAAIVGLVQLAVFRRLKRTLLLRDQEPAERQVR